MKKERNMTTKEKTKEKVAVENKKIDELGKGYLEHAGNEYRKSFLDEYGMYPLEQPSIDFGDLGKFYMVDPKFAEREKEEGKFDYKAFPDEFDLGIFKPLAQADYAPHRYSSDEAADFFENMAIRGPLELGAWWKVPRFAKTALPSVERKSAEHAWPMTVGRKGWKRNVAQVMGIPAASEIYGSTRGDKFFKEREI